MQTHKNGNASAGSHYRPPALLASQIHSELLSSESAPRSVDKIRLHLSFIISRAPEKYVQSVLMVTQLTHTTLDHSGFRNPEVTE